MVRAKNSKMYRIFQAVLFLGLFLACSIVSADVQCSRIQDLQHSAQSALPSARPVAIPIKATVDCLQSIGLRGDKSELIGQMFKYLEWQTDLADLKDPPSDYPYPPHDLLARLADVEAKAQNGSYANEYEFEVELFEKVFAPAHSGHLIFYPDLLTTPWAWARNVSLVSISSDGTALPQIYFRDDVISSPATASPVTEIDGVDSVQFLEDLVSRTAAQDPDAGYNAMFYSKAYVGAGISNGGYFSQGGRPSDVYPGENTTYTFQNGTTVTYDNIALLKWDFTGANNNQIFASRYGGAGYNEQSSIPIPHDPIDYPAAVVASRDNSISGYYLQDELADVAVLSVLSFQPSSVAEFQAVAQTFLADAVRDGKKKLVVDLSANNGGYVLSGYDLYRQIFPQTEQVGYTRYRENELLLSYANISKKLVPTNFDPDTASTTQILAHELSWDYLYDLNTTGQHFPSFEAKFGPRPYKGSNFTALQSWDLNDPLTTINSTFGFGIEITGYGTRKNFTQPFAAEDIILLYDGFCASTCTIFSDFMRDQGHVKSIVLGGRPTTHPTQAVGGVRGGLLATWTDLYQTTDREMQLVQYPDPDYLFIQARRPDTTPMIYSSQAGANIRDVILPEHVADGLPAQFVVQSADCRLFYTRDMVVGVERVWEAAAGAAWFGGECVVGGLSERGVKGRKRGTSSSSSGPKIERRTKRVHVREETVTKDAAWRLKHGSKALE